MKKSQIKILSIVSVVFIVVLGIYMVLGPRNNMGSELLAHEQSLVEKQNYISSDISEEISENIQVYLDPYDIAPLSALVTFRTENDVSTKVTIKGMHNSPDLVKEYAASKDHMLPIYGLYADTNNEVIIEYGDKTETLNIQTDVLPEDFSSGTQTYVNEDYEELIADDFYFVTPASKGYTSAYDKQGNVRWYLTENLVWEIRYLKNGNLVLSNEKLVNPPYYTTGFYEMSMLGKIEFEYLVPGGYHHDLSELPNGNFLVASNDFEYGTVEDVFVEIDRDSGDVVRYTNLRDVLEVEGGKSENWVDFDWFHNNSIWYDEKTNSITLSGRHQDIVVNLDYDTSAINYIVGNSEGFSEDYKKYFLKPKNDLEWQYAQHAAKILPNGDLMLFDNGINRAKDESEYLDANDNYSRGVIYRIDQEQMTIEQIYEYGKARGSKYFSSYISDADYLGENHYLVHSGGVAFNNDNVLNSPPGLTEYTHLKSYTSEVYNDELIFELELNNNYYRAEKMNIYENSNPINMNHSSIKGSLNLTEPSLEKTSFFANVSDDKEVLEQYDIDITKESNRLKISGDFQKEDEVSIVLLKNFKMKEYKIRISERPYTAMCIVIFDNETQSVTQYINDIGLERGEYTILIKINGTLYSTNRRVAIQ